MSTTNDSRNSAFTTVSHQFSIDASTHQAFTAEPRPQISTVAEPMLATTATVVTVQVNPGQEVLEMRLDSKLLGVQEETRRANDQLKSRR